MAPRSLRSLNPFLLWGFVLWAITYLGARLAIDGGWGGSEGWS